MTFSALTEARELYRRAGFEMTSTRAHGPLGPRAMDWERWELRSLACASVNPRIAIALVLVGALALGGDRARGERRRRRATAWPPRTSSPGATMPADARAPDFALRDEQGEPVSMRALRGQPVVVTFLYSHCQDTCPITAQTIRGALDDLGHDVPALAISVDPPNDTPASARKFLAEQRAIGRIRFVLGSRAQLRPIWKGYGITPQRITQEHRRTSRWWTRAASSAWATRSPRRPRSGWRTTCGCWSASTGAPSFSYLAR